MTAKTANSSVSFLKGRLTTLDVFRGITIALMIIVNDPGGDVYYSFLQHATWNGLTFADVVFPFFIFIVGAAIPFSFARRIDQGTSKKKLFVVVVRRTFILFALGLLINLFPTFDLATFRIMGVLQRIALCYFFASIIIMYLKPKWQIILTAAIPIAYWILMSLVPVPAYGAGVLTEKGNLASYIDRFLLNGHLFTNTWDPEGILSTLPAVATCLMGVLAGRHLKSERKPQTKSLNLFFFGSLTLLIGFLWNFWFPINKNLWTSSYVFFTGGIALLVLAVFFYTIEIRLYRWWTKPFTILGLNAISIYVLSEIVNLALIYARIPLTENTSTSLKSLIYERLFSSWAGPLHGSFLYALAYLAFCWAIAGILYRKRIFIKI